MVDNVIWDTFEDEQPLIPYVNALKSSGVSAVNSSETLYGIARRVKEMGVTPEQLKRNIVPGNRLQVRIGDDRHYYIQVLE